MIRLFKLEMSREDAKTLARLARSRDMKAEIVDGQDVIAMYEAMKRAVDHCKSGEGPYFLEAMTYRFRGHSMADPESYRDKEEIEEFRHRDPIDRKSVV